MQSAQTLALRAQPLFESGVANADAVEQIARREGAGLLQRVRRSGPHQHFELHRIDRETLEPEADGLPVRNQSIGQRCAQSLPHAGERMLEAVARLRIAAIAPQQAGQPVARLGRTLRQGENRQQGPVLLARQIHRLAIGQPKVEDTKQLELRDRHLAPIPSARGPRPDNQLI